MILRKIRNWLIAGMVVLLPVGLTIFIVVWLFQYLDNALVSPIEQYTGISAPGLGIVSAFLLFILAGWLTTHLLGRELLGFAETLMHRIPLVKGLYPAVKQLTDAVFSTRDQNFSRVVLVEYPRLGVYSFGFSAGELPGTGLMRVWVAPGPSPTAGPIVLFPTDEVMGLPMAVEDGFKLILSAGAFTPQEMDVQAIGEAVSELKRRRAAALEGPRAD